MIDRKKVVSRHNPIHNEVMYHHPLSVGNGELAYTVDVTGFQTLYNQYAQNGFPLCTMSQWGWHSTPVSNQKEAYTWDDLILTKYDFNGREVTYPVKKVKGNEHVYNWLRENPHRLNLAAIGLIYNDSEISPEDITNITQELDLYKGIILSRFTLDQKEVFVKTMVDPKYDVIGWEIESELLLEGKLKIGIRFPYGSSDKTGSNWHNDQEHQTILTEQTFQRKLDQTTYHMRLESNQLMKIIQNKKHDFSLSFNEEKIALTASFYEEKEITITYEKLFNDNQVYWQSFWEKTGIVDFDGSTDQRAFELERRIILSQYINAIQNTGSVPPQESGLSCNTWYGKFHLEMHLWHNAYLPQWNQSELLKRVIPWYHSNLELAIQNAKRNEYKGARWPKMIGIDGIDSPSPIAPLLIWQQPHIIYMLELIYQREKEEKFLKENWEIIFQTTEFMVDFSTKKEDGKYHLSAPIIPAQERFSGEEVNDPTFELEYWRYNIGIAIKWAKRLGKTYPLWEDVYENLVESEDKEGLLLAYRGCDDMYTNPNYITDHPSMVGALGLIPNDRIEPSKFRKTLDKVYEVWDFKSMWGWDFAVMAMTETRLGYAEKAMDILMMDTYKNQYYINGHNFQVSRPDLPVYLPGNGSLLIAIALMIAGYPGSEELPGIPKNGQWKVKYENIYPLPF